MIQSLLMFKGILSISNGIERTKIGSKFIKEGGDVLGNGEWQKD